MLNLDSQTRKMHDEYDMLFRQCVGLNAELHKLGPLARQMRLLSANAICSAARAGSEGDAFRVLTQDIQSLANEVSDCILDSQKLIGHIAKLASNLARLFAGYIKYRDLQRRIEMQQNQNGSDRFVKVRLNKVIGEINLHNEQLKSSIHNLIELLSPLVMLVKKGQYLAVYSSVETASAGGHGTSFAAVARLLRELVTRLGEQSTAQRSLLRELSDSMDNLEFSYRYKQYAG